MSSGGNGPGIGLHRAPKNMSLNNLDSLFNSEIHRKLFSNRNWLEMRGKLCPLIGFLGLNNSITTGCDSSHCDPGMKILLPRQGGWYATRWGPLAVQHGIQKHGTHREKNIKVFGILSKGKNQYLKQVFMAGSAINVNFQVFQECNTLSTLFENNDNTTNSNSNTYRMLTKCQALVLRTSHTTHFILIIPILQMRKMTLREAK